MMKKISVKLKSKPISISPEYRVEYKVCMLVVILYFSCRKNKASINKINYIMNLLSTHISMTNINFLKSAENNYSDLDKTLNKVINLAIIDDIVKVEDGEVILLDKGMELVEFIINNSLFNEEVKLLMSKKKDFISENRLK